VRLRRTLSTIAISAGCALALSGCVAPRSSGPLLSAPPSAAADNDVYVSDAAGRIRALRPDGTEQWTFSLPDELARLDATASRDVRVDYLVARSGGRLYGVATQETGRNAGRPLMFALEGNRLLWRVEPPYPEQNGAPIAVGQSVVYEAGDDGALYAFARADGRRLWKYQVSPGTLGSPTVGADGTVYVTGARHNLHALTPEGAQRWVVETQQ
jgi:outer membrane protein assembly factor BamB